MNRPVLAPGLRVLRRSREELQIGLAAGHRVRLPDTEPVRRTLARLTRGEAVPDDPQTREVMAALAPVLVDGAGLVDPGASAGDVAALALRDPSAYRSRLAARRTARIVVQGDVGAPGAQAAPLLAAAGVPVVDEAVAGRPDAVLVLSTGEIDRGALDPLVRHGVPHLLLRLIEGSAVVGPFVEPGRTACLRCLDAHLSVHRPETTALAHRHAAAARDRRDGVAEPVDSALAALAVGWAARDLVSFVEGERPATWSATVELSPTLSTVSRTEWLRNPACGCGWVSGEQPSSTMAG